MQVITNHEIKRYFENLTDDGKLQAIMYAMLGNKEDKQFLVDCIKGYSINYPTLKPIKVMKTK